MQTLLSFFHGRPCFGATCICTRQASLVAQGNCSSWTLLIALGS